VTEYEILSSSSNSPISFKNDSLFDSHSDSVLIIKTPVGQQCRARAPEIVYDAPNTDIAPETIRLLPPTTGDGVHTDIYKAAGRREGSRRHLQVSSDLVGTYAY